MTDLYIRHGGIPPLGIHVSHSWHEIGAILHIIDTYEVDRFVEIGAHRGGLGLLLHHRHDVEYLGVEIDPFVLDPHFLDVADLIIGDVFLYTIAIRQFIEEGKTPLIYCDGGDKPREFKVFSEVLQHGLIMVHDYRAEFNETHFKDTKLERIDADFLKGNRQVLFKKGNVRPKPLSLPAAEIEPPVKRSVKKRPVKKSQSRQSKQSREKDENK